MPISPTAQTIVSALNTPGHRVGFANGKFTNVEKGAKGALTLKQLNTKIQDFVKTGKIAETDLPQIKEAIAQRFKSFQDRKFGLLARIFSMDKITEAWKTMATIEATVTNVAKNTGIISKRTDESSLPILGKKPPPGGIPVMPGVGKKGKNISENVNSLTSPTTTTPTTTDSGTIGGPPPPPPPAFVKPIPPGTNPDKQIWDEGPKPPKFGWRLERDKYLVKGKKELSKQGKKTLNSEIKYGETYIAELKGALEPITKDVEQYEKLQEEIGSLRTNLEELSVRHARVQGFIDRLEAGQKSGEPVEFSTTQGKQIAFPDSQFEAKKTEVAELVSQGKLPKDAVLDDSFKISEMEKAMKKQKAKVESDMRISRKSIDSKQLAIGNLQAKKTAGQLNYTDLKRLKGDIDKSIGNWVRNTDNRKKFQKNPAATTGFALDTSEEKVPEDPRTKIWANVFTGIQMPAMRKKKGPEGGAIAIANILIQ